jgi:hypothetical protein
MRNLRKLTNDAGSNYNDSRFKTKLIDSFPESWDAIYSICYNMQSLSEVISMLTSHGEWCHTKVCFSVQASPELKV